MGIFLGGVGVSAINGKEIKVTFNQAVEKSSVITAGTPDVIKVGAVNVTRTSTDAHTADVAAALTGYKASLSEDGKTLTILAGSAKFFKGNYDVKVSGAVKKDTLDVIENYYGKFIAKDDVAPTVTKAVYNVATDQFEVTLSEPIDAITGQVLRVNGQPISTFDTPSSYPATKLTFDRPAEVAPGTSASLYIAGLKDASGNLMTSYTGSVEVAQDTAALAVDEVKQVLNNKVRVTLNKKLDSGSNSKILTSAPNNGLVVIKSDGTVTTNYTVAAAAASVNPNGNVYDITLTDATYANGDTENFSITFVDKAFKGVSGTTNAVYTKNVSLTKDTVAPTVTSTKVSLDGEALEVTMSEGVTVDQSKVKLRRNGAELTSVTATLKAGTDNVLVVKTTDATAVTASKLNAGTYQVRLETAAVTDLNGVTNATTNAPTVVVGDSSTVTPVPSTIATAGGTNVFTVTAPGTQTFTTESLSYTNFVLDGKVISADSDITLNPARTVITIKLPTSNSVNIAGSALLEAAGLTYTSGTPFAVTTATVTVADNTAATLTSSKILGNTLELTFDEAINAGTLADIDEILADLTIKSDMGTFAKTAVGVGSVATASVDAGSASNKIVITVVPEDSNWSTVVSGTNLTVTTKGTGVVTNLEDANTVKVKAGVKVSVSK